MSWKWNKPKKDEPLRIPSTEERAKLIKKKGGFDGSWYDKKAKKQLSKVHKCFWCKKYLKPTFLNNRTGEIIMSCDSPGCIGNIDTPEQARIRKLKKMGVESIDKKLVTDLKQLLYGRDLKRMGAVKDRIW